MPKNLPKNYLERLSREAKALRKGGTLTHALALDLLAVREGYPSWWQLQHAFRRLAAATAAVNAVVRFSMDAKDADGYSDEQLAAVGIHEDFDFKPADDPDDPEPWDSPFAWDRIFRIDGWCAVAVTEVLERLSKTFFFPPTRIWLGKTLHKYPEHPGGSRKTRVDLSPPPARDRVGSRDGAGRKFEPPVPTAGVSFYSRQRPGPDRVVELRLGGSYRIQPLNPAKLKHRNRECILLSLFDPDKHRFEQVPLGVVDFHVKSALVRFKDTNRRGQADPSDLVPA